MPQFRRVGHDDDAYTANMPANADPEFWQPVDAAAVVEETPAPTEAPAAETEESDA